jgi:selenocysteine lyase/cysteine desulfurase
VPVASVAAARAEQEREASDGRMRAHFERRFELAARLRAAYAARLAAPAEQVALTTCTTDGMARVLAGLKLGPGDEVLAGDAEHPGLLGPLSALRRRGVRVRTAPLAALPAAVGPATRLVACSHVSWVNGERAPAALGELDVPVLLDGAQGVGAVPVDVEALGCDAYAGAGQKWLCGPDGLGMLWVSPALRERLTVSALAYVNLQDPNAGLDARPWPDARVLDAPALPAASLAAALAALEVLEAEGWEQVHARAAALAARFADALRERGRTVAPRDGTTLVAWETADAPAEVERLAAAGVALRYLPGTGLVRASVGAWNDEGDLRRLLDAL